MTLDPEAPNAAASEREMNRRRIVTWLLALAVLSAIVFGLWGPISYLAGFLKSFLLLILFGMGILASGPVLFIMACVQSVRKLLARRKMEALLWLGIAFGIVLAVALEMTGRTPAPVLHFGHGLLRRLEIRTDMDAVQKWVASMDPEDYVNDPDFKDHGKYLSKEEQPKVLQRQNGMVRLELDEQNRLRMRLLWSEGRGGMWGLVIGHQDMKTPPSEPEMYGEQRTELRPGIYFWYVEG